MRTNSNRRSVKKQLLIVIALALTLLLSFIFFSNRAAAETRHDTVNYYTSYEIQPGDTLWSIADSFMTPDSSDKLEFIENVKRLNHLSSDNITAGNYIVIEYTAYQQ